MMKFIEKIKLPQNGDTIVEVMISMAVLALVMGTAYATSTRSFQAGLNSQYRDQAVYYAQQQVELLKNADDSQPSTISSYELKNQAFCINPGTMAVEDVAQGDIGCSLPIGGTGSSNQDLFKGSLTYDDSSKTFNSTVQWTSASGRSSQITIYYKANDSFSGALGNPPTTGTTTAPPTCPTGQIGTPPNCVTPSPPGSTMTLTMVSVNGATSIKLTWANSNVDTCTIIEQFNNGSPTNLATETGQSANSGTYTLNNPPPGNYSFHMNCTGPGGSVSSNTASVTVNAPPPPPAYVVIYQCGDQGVGGCTTPYTGYSAMANRGGYSGMGSRYYGSMQYFNATFPITIYDNRGVCEYFYHSSSSMGEHINGGVDKVYRNPMVSLYGYQTGGNCSNQT